MVYKLNVYSPGNGGGRELFDTLLFPDADSAAAYVGAFDEYTQEDWFDEDGPVKAPKARLAADYTPPNPDDFRAHLRDVGYGEYADLD